MELPHAFQVFSFMWRFRMHVIKVFTIIGWLSMYGKPSRQYVKLDLWFCGCCCARACSVLMAPQGVPHECMIRWRLSLEHVFRTCSSECHAGYPTMWENLDILGALAGTMREYSHIVWVIAHHGAFTHVFQVFSFMGGFPIHVMQGFTLMGWLTI